MFSSPLIYLQSVLDAVHELNALIIGVELGVFNDDTEPFLERQSKGRVPSY